MNASLNWRLCPDFFLERIGLCLGPACARHASIRLTISRSGTRDAVFELSVSAVMLLAIFSRCRGDLCRLSLVLKRVPIGSDLSSASMSFGTSEIGPDKANQTYSTESGAGESHCRSVGGASSSRYACFLVLNRRNSWLRALAMSLPFSRCMRRNTLIWYRDAMPHAATCRICGRCRQDGCGPVVRCGHAVQSCVRRPAELLLLSSPLLEVKGHPRIRHRVSRPKQELPQRPVCRYFSLRMRR